MKDICPPAGQPTSLEWQNMVPRTLRGWVRRVLCSRICGTAQNLNTGTVKMKISDSGFSIKKDHNTE